MSNPKNAKAVDRKDFEAYLKEARSWETDKVVQAEASQRTAWRVATGACAVALLSVVALVGLTPLKQVMPYVIRVDSSTGIVDVVQSIRDGKENYDEAVNKYFLQWYVRYREGYSKELAEDYYRNVGLMSSSLESQKYFAAFNPKNPLSPLNVYGPYARVRINIISTSFVNDHVALVRYVKLVERGTDTPIATHWVATVNFVYSKASMVEKDREVNPLGFQVREYRNDPDSLAESDSQQRAMVPVVAPPLAPAVTVFPTAVPTPLPPMSAVPLAPGGEGGAVPVGPNAVPVATVAPVAAVVVTPALPPAAYPPVPPLSR